MKIKCSALLRVILWISLTYINLISTVKAAEHIQEVVLWLGHSKARFPYEVALTTLALNKTKSSYGDYRLKILTNTLSSQRGLRMIREGQIDMFISGDRLNDQDYLNSIRMPIWEGLLGYRKLIVHRDKLKQFSNINSIDDLKKYRVGQGKNWTDIRIYEKNEIDILTSISFQSMYGMLHAGRFDFLPLGINEIQSNLAEANASYPELTIVPDLLIRYPLDVYFQVSAKNPNLAKRMKEGLQLAQDDGSWAQLKNIYLSEYLEMKSKSTPRIIDLKAPW